jgi:hypothetical protein
MTRNVNEINWKVVLENLDALMKLLINKYEYGETE